MQPIQHGAWALCIFIAATAAAHEGGHGPADVHESRLWTTKSGTLTFQGVFESARDGKVFVRSTEGKVISLDFETLSGQDRHWVEVKMDRIREMNANRVPLRLVSRSEQAPRDESSAQVLREAFAPFEKSLGLRWDDRFFYVESNGMPDHQMMIGITAWQQQVPIPQNYKGSNAWRIPLYPVPARNPISAKDNFFSGAIALAINGIPIFNPIKNDGVTDTNLAGELDKFGGHCGRADDYHYHLPPTHLQENTGLGRPIAYALDGYPIFGFDEPDGKPAKDLDKFNGHKDSEGKYHYHSTKTYPYLNGGFFGEVTERDGQVDPQPHADPVRSALPPLRGATITGFDRTQDDKTMVVNYDLDGDKRGVRYTFREDGSIHFSYDDGTEGVRTETYRRDGRNRGEQEKRKDQQKKDQRKKGGPQGKNEPREKGERNPPAKKGGPRGDSRQEQTNPPPNDSLQIESPRSGKFLLKSSAFMSGSKLPLEFTGDGEGISPPLAWEGAPAETASYALVMDHITRDGERKVYWVLWDIPASIRSLPKDSHEIGTTGATWKPGVDYVPPRSAGPGEKNYKLTLYALSVKPAPQARDGKVTRDELLNSIRGKVLDSAEMNVRHERPE